MDRERSSRGIILMKGIAFFLLLLIFSLSLISLTKSASRISVTISNVYYKPSSCGGKTLYMDVTIANPNAMNFYLYLPHVVTNRGVHYLEGNATLIPSSERINVTFHTREKRECDSLLYDEVPQKFVYNIELVEPFPPVEFSVDIPENLISGGIVGANPKVQTLWVVIE